MAAPDRNLEREVKLVAADDFSLPDLASVGGGVVLGGTTTATHTDSYHDTDEFRLIRAGITVRRRDEDTRSTWTVKVPTPAPDVADGLSRLEINIEASGARMPREVVRLVRARARSAPLRLVTRLSNRRRSTIVTDGHGPVAQIDDDEVTVAGGAGAGQGFREIEVELLADAPAQLLGALVRALRQAGARPADPTPKLAQVLGAVAAAPPDLAPVELGDKPSLSEVVWAALTDHVRRLVDHDPIIRLDLDPEGVHQARVATRRLRADLRTFRPVVDREWSEPLRDELRGLGRALGTVRDGDVMLEELRDRTADLPDGDRRAAERLVGRLERERADALDRLQRLLDGARYVRLLDQLVEGAAEPRFDVEVDVERPAADVLPDLVAKPWKKLRREIRRLDDRPPDEALHRVRIRAKRARYAAEAAAAVGEEADRLADRLADLQDELGDLQDAVVAEGWLRRAAGAGSTDEALVAGLLVAREQAEAADHRAVWEAVWDRADRKKLTRWMK